ncbi:ABC transporter ATP-binding protein [Candidatus Chlorohelix sp.]|uniref:ABC transporter ATP-binding protein n=1 Tax=Candidatus Chlorohelix sp. TaxID=3139201 RepID=UPI00303E4E9F
MQGHMINMGSPMRGGGKHNKSDKFELKQVFSAFTSLPRVLKLVWATHPTLTIAMGIISIARGFMPAISIWITKLLIDGVVSSIKTQDFFPVFQLVLLQLLIEVFSRLLTTLGNIVQQLLQERVSVRVQVLILEKSNTLDLSFFENPEFYDKLRQASEQSVFRPVQMISQTFDLGRTLITFISMIFLLLRLEWWLAAVALIVPIPAFIADSRYGWMGYQRMRWQSPERRQMQYFNMVMTTDTYNKEIKLFNLGNFFIDQYRKLGNKLYDENKALLVRRYMTSFLWMCLSIIANAAIYLYVAWQAVMSRITLGDLTLFTQTAVQVSQSFQSILSGISSTYENNLFVGTLFEFLEYKPNISSPEKPSDLAVTDAQKGLDVEFRNVSFTYPGKREAVLKNVSFTIAPGEAVALVGRNGAGKTTLVKLLTRLYDPDEGEILIGGRNIKEYNLKELREQVGVIFQDYATYFMSARENIGVGRLAEIENLELVTASARKSGADAVIDKLPKGYESMLGRWFTEGTQLSGGEWQKIALARAFIRDARILVLDEPTSSLDAQAEYEVFASFRELTEGKTAIFISHRFSTVRLADRIFVLENGEIIENGSHHELMILDGRYAELFNLQAEAYR